MRRDFSYATDEYFLADADAILSALAAARFKVLSREPTEAMARKNAAMCSDTWAAYGHPELNADRSNHFDLVGRVGFRAAWDAADILPAHAPTPGRKE